MKKKIILFLAIILNIVLSLSCILNGTGIKVSAETPYKTYTVDRYNELVETQDAYTPFSSIKITYNNIEMKDAQDMVFDKEDNLYIADSGNDRGLILDKNFNVVTSFGETENVTYPRGIYVIESETSRVNYIYLTDYNKDTKVGRILRYTYNLDTNQVELNRIYGSPSSWILDTDGYTYMPIKIAVSNTYYMYVTAEGATSGVLMITPENEFITYFAANSIKFSLMDRIKYFFYGDNEKAELKKNVATPPYNIMLDGTGYVYTITQTSIDRESMSSNFKKVNTGGINYFPNEMYGARNMEDSYFGKYSNTYAVTSDGFIYEYDNEGNLLFKFSGLGTGKDVYGLFSSASSITVDSKDYVYVIDDTRNNLQVFKPTIYCNLVHEALLLYTGAKYEESKDIWEEVLRYNSMFDLAHKGVGLAYYMQGNYKDALKEFYIADDKVDYSDAFWEIRNIWLTTNLGSIFLIAFIVIALLIATLLLNKKYHFLRVLKYPFIKLSKIKFINQIFYSFRFMKKPSDTIYEIRYRERASVLSSSVLLVVIFFEYLLGLLYTGFIFNNTVIEKTILLNEGIKIVLPIILFIVANYLMSALMEGEGRFKDIFTTTIGSLTPIIVMYPIIILISNLLTLNEQFIYYFLIVVMFIYCGCLLFYGIKETHNYTVGQTVVNILLTVFMLLILILLILILYIMAYQIYSFISDIIKEAIING